MKKKYEFKPDAAGAGLLRRLYLPRRQRLQILKWLLCGLCCTMMLVIQDVVFSRVRIFGATTDLLACALMLICMLHGADRTCIFLLVMSLIYHFSGSAPGSYVVIALPLIAILVSIFRERFLRSGFAATLLCTGVGLVLYELVKFLFGLLSGTTSVAWIQTFLLTAVLSVAAVPLLYPLMMAISKIGGNTWKE